MGRDKSTITRFCVKQLPRKKLGRKPALTTEAIDILERTLREMIATADGAYEVTVLMLKRRCRCKASVRRISVALHKRGIWFRKMRLKPRLTKEDIKERWDFSKEYEGKAEGGWGNTIHAAIDCKLFPVFLHHKARLHAAQSGTRGVYRKRGDGLGQGYTKTNPRMKYNSGAEGVHVLAGMGGNGKILLWEYFEGSWSGKMAADMYQGPVSQALRRAYPGRRRFRVLEDNDPTGFKSKKGIAAKAECNIDVFHIPPHSPDLNPCDFSLWKTVNRRMRSQEKA